MKLLTYLKKLGLSEYIIDKVIKLINDNHQDYIKYIDNLTDRRFSENEYIKIKKDYPNDNQNFHIFSIYLLASLKTYELYKKYRIDDNIFYDTFGCFSRFINECIVMNNEEYFDRDFWVYRQLSLQEFRLGQLEYEYVNYNNDKYISIHIPSDAILTEEEIDKSFRLMYSFTEKNYPDYLNVKKTCYSWLLSPVLKELLDDNSRILIFQKYFDIIRYDEECKDYIGWLFKKKENCNIDEYPENTTLQKRFKNYLLHGGKSGNGYGILKK